VKGFEGIVIAMRILILLLAVVGAAVIIGGGWFLADGISARPAPSPMEVALADRLRALAIPSAASARTNPEPETPEVLAEGRAHFADHCASCHANDGTGKTEMGQGLSPRAPDLRSSATQALSDGTLFYIIENGVKLTGMPAWATGTAEGEAASWRLVRFIRHLPSLSEAELQQMESLNPKSAEEWRQADEERKFLEGR
jgi:mono/diheme cytochrome c family protein